MMNEEIPKKMYFQIGDLHLLVREVDKHVMKLEAENKQLKAQDAKLVKALDDTLTAWDRLPKGHHTPYEIQNWMTDYLCPAILKLKAIQLAKGEI